MEVIAVVQLDRLLNQYRKIDGENPLQSLETQVNVLRQSHTINKWIFTASNDYSASLSLQSQSQLGIKLIFGLNSDPLNEFYLAARGDRERARGVAENPTVVRLVPGSERPQTEVVDAMVENHIFQGHHYSRSRQLDDGAALFVEIMNFSVLDEAWIEAILPDDRLNITPYIYRQQQRLSVGFFPPTESAFLIA
jgi:spore coat polysaccharide biosynthesis protein SpsF (cytidylyltransferase family)